MSQVNAFNHQVGMNSTPENNFVLSASGNDGTMTVKRGGVAQQQVLGFDANGYTTAITPPKGDVTTKSATTAFVKNAMVASGVIGKSANAYMLVPTDSASATFTADMLVVAESLSGQTYSLSSLNLAINLATVGAGGMDTGAAPASGYVAIYTIYNPTTQVSALLGANATSAVAPEVYGGASMPTGYTASALIGVFRTTAASLLLACFLEGRKISISPVVSGITTNTTYALGSVISVAGMIPKNAKTIAGSLIIQSSAQSGMNALVSSGPQRFGEQGMTSTVAAGFAQSAAYGEVAISAPQMVGIAFISNAGTPAFSLFITSYTF